MVVLVERQAAAGTWSDEPRSRGLVGHMMSRGRAFRARLTIWQNLGVYGLYFEIKYGSPAGFGERAADSMVETLR